MALLCRSSRSHSWMLSIEPFVSLNTAEQTAAKEDLEDDTAKYSSTLETAMSRVTLDGEVSNQDRISQCTVEQTLDVHVLEMVESPTIVSQDRIQQRTLDQIVDTPIPQVVAETPKVFSQDRVQQRFGEQTIEPPCCFTR